MNFYLTDFSFFDYLAYQFFSFLRFCKQYIKYIISLPKLDIISDSFSITNSTVPQMQSPISNTKYDICFSNSLEQVKRSLMIKIVLHAVQMITMSIMIPLDIYVFNKGNERQEILSFFIIGACTTFINFLCKFLLYYNQLNDHNNCLSMATDLNHIVQQQPSSQRLSQPLNPNLANSSNSQYVSSTIYNVQTNILYSQTTEVTRLSIQPAMRNMIQALASSRDPCNRCMTSLGSLVSLGLFVYGIVIMATVPMKVGEIIVICLFLLSELIIQFQVFACLIFIALVPLLCVFACIFCCFCRQGVKQAKLPQAVPATVQIISKSDGEPCTICYQTITLDQKVIVLPCSQKHVFHDKCLNAWVVMKPTCPNCRFDLSQ